ncbi:hypothetical protein KA005_12650 [bacterium]|nr:hypothetical protein [bacterium]
MKILHILKTEPDKNVESLINIISQGEEASIFKLYDERVDYEKFIDLVFEHDKTISWW